MGRAAGGVKGGTDASRLFASKWDGHAGMLRLLVSPGKREIQASCEISYFFGSISNKLKKEKKTQSGIT